MKRIGFVVLLITLMTTAAIADEIDWLTDYDKALTRANATGQNVFLLITAPSWCGYCQKLDRETFPNEDVISLLNDGFVPVMITDENPQVQWFDFRGYPTMRIMDSNGEMVSETVGFRPPRDLLIWAVDFANEADGSALVDNDEQQTGIQDTNTVDAVLDAGNRKIYLFKGSWVLLYDVRTIEPVEGYPKRISEVFPGIPDNIDAAVSWSNNIYYFFKDDQYWRVNGRNNTVDPGYPKPFTGDSWTGLELLDK